MNPPAEDRLLVEIGRLGRPWGLKGELLFRAYNDGGLEFYKRFRTLRLEGRGKPRTVKIDSWRVDGGGRLYVRPVGCASPEEARRYSNSTASVPAGELPDPAPGDYYVYQLLGCRVVDEDGTELGVLDALEEGVGGANDVMTVVGEQTLLIPFIRRFVKRIDLEQRLIVVDPPEIVEAQAPQ
ncbi:MAG: 16S rRNA processing protein RimM [Candidatus Coatesbacteria bacterium]|nr:16S rRNA processing protein RimM [Candidatus Coatesbacteria bacterium]